LRLPSGTKRLALPPAGRLSHHQHSPVSPTAIVALGFPIADWPITRYVVIASSVCMTVRMTHSASDATHTGHEEENRDTDCDPNPILSEPCHFRFLPSVNVQSRKSSCSTLRQINN
jgi:hypothetical protein